MKLRFKKGLDLSLAGAVTSPEVIKYEPDECAIVPDDFSGFIPKLMVREGDDVKVGSPLMHDKVSEDLCLVSPVSGTVKAVVRGDRRKIMRVVILNDHKYESLSFDTSLTALELLAGSGMLAMLRRRPYDVVVRTAVRPADIFITALDTAPLATSLVSRLPADSKNVLVAAVKVLNSLTDGSVNLCVGDDWKLGDVTGAVMHTISGPHPAGNVGVQLSAIAPAGPGREVWTLDVVTLYNIGVLLTEGKLNPWTIVAVTGPQVKTPCRVNTNPGASLPGLLADRLKEDRHCRVISGNVLTGTAVGDDDAFLRYPYRQVTVIAEGDDVDEFMGWASMKPSKLSISAALPLSRLTRKFAPDARLNGGRRAMIMSGEYDRVLPMDIMPEFLLKAIIGRNIPEMEALGIYEIAPEDFALCEFVDTSKLPIQQIIRDGLDYLRKENE